MLALVNTREQLKIRYSQTKQPLEFPLSKLKNVLAFTVLYRTYIWHTAKRLCKTTSQRVSISEKTHRIFRETGINVTNIFIYKQGSCRI